MHCRENIRVKHFLTLAAAVRPGYCGMMQGRPQNSANRPGRQSVWFAASLAAGLAGALIINSVYAEPGANLWWLFIVCPLAVYALLLLVGPLFGRD